ncbi:MAG: hypothetical protein FWF53_01380 [Candidatus Azobacteroides sp.]|nr:hypothetical protein [Candidatus Azobacteroides sp.]
MKKNFILSFVFVLLTGSLCAQTQIIAHRGFWNREGSAQNSLMENRVEYISFSKYICRELKRKSPTSIVAFLASTTDKPSVLRTFMSASQSNNIEL